MRLISRKNLRHAAASYPSLISSIDAWYKIVKVSNWNSLEDVRETFPSAEAVGNFTVFNIKGNHYRLIVYISYQKQKIYFKYLLTHAEYSKDKWKNDPYF